jgi:hypothetical protein
MKVRNKDLVPVWAENPAAFNAEPKHVQDEFRGAVEAARAKAAKATSRAAAKAKPGKTTGAEETSTDDAESRPDA